VCHDGDILADIPRPITPEKCTREQTMIEHEEAEFRFFVRCVWCWSVYAFEVVSALWWFHAWVGTSHCVLVIKDSCSCLDSEKF